MMLQHRTGVPDKQAPATLNAARRQGQAHCWAEAGLAGADVALAAPAGAAVLAERGFDLLAAAPESSLGAAATVAFLAFGLAGAVVPTAAVSSEEDADADLAR